MLNRLSSQGELTRPLWFDSFIIFAILFVIYLATADYSPVQINDAASALTAAWSSGQHHTLDMRVSPAPLAWYVEIDGRALSDRMLGVIAWATPFYVFLGNPNAPTMFPAAVAASSATAGAGALLFLTLCRLVSRRAALVSVAVMAFGTSTWSVSAHSLWPHGPDQLWLAAMMAAVSAQRWGLGGLASGAAILTRPTLAVGVAAIGLLESIHHRRPRPAVLVAAGAAIGVLVLLFYNYRVFGTLRLYVGSYERFEQAYQRDGQISASIFDLPFLLQNFAGALVSPARGLLTISPFLILLLPGLPHAWRTAPNYVRNFSLGGSLILILQMVTNHFGGGNAFYGYRYTLEALTMFAPLLVLAWEGWTSRGPVRRRLFFALVAYSVWTHAVAVVSQVNEDAKLGAAWRHFLILRLINDLDGLRWVGLIAFAIALIAGLIALERRLTRHRPRDLDV